MWRDERGAAAVEMPLAIAFLLIPVAYLVLMVAPWGQRANLARLAAAEAARAIVLAPTADPDDAAVYDLVATIAANHDIPIADVDADLCVADGMTPAEREAATCDALIRGGVVTVDVSVRIPLVAVPGIGDAGGFTWTWSHTELVDQFRSFDP